MPALAIINHLLEQNPEIQTQMPTHAGRSIRIVLPMLTLNACIDQQGYLRHTDNSPETTLTIHTSAIRKHLQGDAPGVGDVTVSGHQNLGMVLLPLLSGLRYWARDDIAHLFGETAAVEWQCITDKLKHNTTSLAHTLTEQLSDYAQETKSILVHQNQLIGLAQEIESLRDDVARLAARLEQITARKQH